MRNLSIGSRVALIAVLSSFLTVVVLSATAYNELIRDFENVLTQRQLLDAESIANRVDQDLQVRIQALGAFAATLTDGKNRLSKDRIEALLGRHEQHPARQNGAHCKLDACPKVCGSTKLIVEALAP